MSMYNMLFGVNPFSKVYLEMLGLDFEKVPRFRDTFLDEENNQLYLVVYTRTGGGNREYYVEENNYMKNNPYYAFDRDDDFDSTYAYFFFNLPESAKEAINDIARIDHNLPPADKWKRMFKAMEKGDQSDPQFKRALEVGDKLFGDIKKALDNEQSK